MYLFVGNQKLTLVKIAISWAEFQQSLAHFYFSPKKVN